MNTLKRQGVCPKCKSADIVPNVEAVDSSSLSIRIYGEAGGYNGKARNFPVRAWVCSACGYTELYVSQPQEVLKAYRQIY